MDPETTPDYAKHGILRIAYTPADDPDATVIAEAHNQPSPSRNHEDRERAIARSTCFQLNNDSLTGWRLPIPVMQRILTDAPPDSLAAATGALGVWTWSEHPGGKPPFLLWFFPRLTINRAAPGYDPKQPVLELFDDPTDPCLVAELRTAELTPLPYWEHLPESERPAWRGKARAATIGSTVLPAVTPQPEPSAPAG